MDDDLNPTKTQGFKVGEKKTIDEYQKLGTENVLCTFEDLLSKQSSEVFSVSSCFTMYLWTPFSAFLSAYLPTSNI